MQLEWIFLQHVTKDTGQAFVGVEKVLWENVLPCIFFVKPTPPSRFSSSKYISGKEIRDGPTELCDIISREI